MVNTDSKNSNKSQKSPDGESPTRNMTFSGSNGGQKSGMSG
jgi:hypothetical protein